MNDAHSPDFLLSDPLEIGSALNELLRNPDRLEAGSREVVTHAMEILSVDVSARRFCFRPIGNDAWTAVRHATELRFTGAAHGAQIEFTVNGHQLVADGASRDRSTFEVVFPQTLRRVQRREFFRVPVGAAGARGATWRTAQGDELQVRIHDVSMAGVGLRSPLTPDALPPEGTEIEDVLLDFGEHGEVRAGLRVVKTFVLEEPDPRQPLPVQVTHLGCEFLDLDRCAETFLQRLVYQTESAQRAKRFDR